MKDAKRESVPDLQLRAGEKYNGENVSESPTKATGAQSFASAGINIPLWNRTQGNIGFLFGGCSVGSSVETARENSVIGQA